MESTTTKALKEWAVAINALEEGKTIMLMRKGGIREESNRFQVTCGAEGRRCHRILLYPTYEHQQPNLLKPEYAPQVTPVPSGWHPETVKISSVAKITDIFKISEQKTLTSLLPHHIWNEEFATTRLKWKPKQPLYILLLRTYKLPSTSTIPYQPEYGGCRSWIDLNQPISLTEIKPVIDDNNYTQQIAQIHQIIREN
ncbi:DUF1802 family protein [Limnofasciculus baicalensis]|uniref:DUF1802 family protein n=1 Tax=Limnofasciculus baicalensis BBK-W-15 TaxID=2699891 RepID=A0AAE3KQC4_9CYAN|nr:DUF1802 family protein [Limnofasciculus baicalensis]MCP2730558.1 DUF1802 family protein [Limnofasciculus baicalensis BBK-W-15]